LSRLNVLALAGVPVEAAATRFRLVQLCPALAARGIDVTLRPFVDARTFETLYDRSAWPRTAAGFVRATGRRLSDLASAGRFDRILVLREAMLFGPPLVERVASRAGRRPMVLDLDDATYVAYDSPTYGRLGRFLKWPGKTDDLIDLAQVVTCGNPVIRDYVVRRGTDAVVVPAVVDTDQFTPRPAGNRIDPPVVGWIGTHSTFAYLEGLAPVLTALAEEHRFRLLIVGSGRDTVDLPGVDVELRSWRLHREVADFQSLDIGLYPLPGDDWATGKSGLKAVQYMAVGVPYVTSPVGAAGQLGEDGVTHLRAHTPDEWRDALALLLSDAERRQEMGAAGRRHAVAHHGLGHAVEPLARALTGAGPAPRTAGL
jgi:glycosyltransferase involved in cell wall biosynthesis